MSAKHTPGPWHRPVSDKSLLVMCDGQLIAQVAQLRCIGGYDDLAALRAAEQEQANARLIAAAPELLQACEAALPAMEPDATTQQVNEAFRQLRAALAKARGES